MSTKYPLFCSFLITAMVLLLTSCGPNAADPGDAEAENPPTEPDAGLSVASFRSEAESILQFWLDHGPETDSEGYVGRIDFQGTPQADADKAVILNSRILWTFSAAGRELGGAAYREQAERAYRYFRRHFVDPEHGGVYWMLNADGQMKEGRKQVYAQSFGIYAFSEYHRLTGEPQALDDAIAIFELLEAHAYDPENGGYYDSFDRAWQRLDDTYLGAGETKPAKTMNTHLHLLEAFTNLYRTWKDERLATRLEELINIHLNEMLNRKNYHLYLFFAPDWQVLSDDISYGHDIEASWLLTEAAEVLGKESVIAEVEEIAVHIAEATLQEGLDPDGGLLYEADPHGYTNTDKSWWPQAEAVVGFYNAYQLSGEPRFRDAAAQNWAFTREYLIDREHGEWLRMVTREGDREAAAKGDKGGPWKAPYHNTRSCLEMIRRLEAGS